MMYWKVCTNYDYVSLINTNTVLELYELEIHQKISKPDSQRDKTMVKRSIDSKIRARNFEARNERVETKTVVKDRRGQRGVARGLGKLSMGSKRTV